MRLVKASLISAISLGVGAPIAAQTLSGPALVNALQQGGYALVVRHASSPTNPPDAQTANADNVQRERQLDANGRATATAMGEALRALKIPIGEVLSSPTYRALETARFMRLPNPRAVAELGDRGQSMQGVSGEQTAWLKARVTERPLRTNTVLVTHLQNITTAFPQWTAGFNEGETLVLQPDGRGGATMVARVRIEEWPRLASPVR